MRKRDQSGEPTKVVVFRRLVVTEAPNRGSDFPNPILLVKSHLAT